MAEVEISPELIQKAMHHPDVVAHLEVVASRIASRAVGIAKSEEVEMEIWVESGVRPGGRPYANVVADNDEQEFGSARSKRFRVIGRAGEAG